MGKVGRVDRRFLLGENAMVFREGDVASGGVLRSIGWPVTVGMPEQADETFAFRTAFAVGAVELVALHIVAADLRISMVSDLLL